MTVDTTKDTIISLKINNQVLSSIKDESIKRDMSRSAFIRQMLTVGLRENNQNKVGVNLSRQVSMM